MATPAASAFHRRRLINNSSQNALPTARRAAPSDPPPVQSMLTNPTAPPIPRNYAQPRPVLSPSSLSFSTFCYSFLSPFLSFAHTAFPRVVAATLISLALAHVVRLFLISTVGSLFLSCAARPPSLPIPVVFVNFVLLLPLVLLVLVTHFVLLNWATASPSFSLGHHFLSIVTTPPLALIFSYLIYGPFLSPHQFYCTLPTSVFPSRHSATTPLFAAFFAAPVLTYLTFRLRPHTPPPYPFPRSPLRRALSAFPPAILIATLSTLPALLPTLFSALVSRPPRTFYSSLLLTLSRSISASFATSAALLPHTLLLAYHPQSETPIASAPSPDTVQQARSALTSAPTSHPAEVRRALNTLSAHPACLHPFPPFADPSARLWRASLDAALAPISALADYLRPQHGYPEPAAVLQPNLYPVNNGNATSSYPPHNNGQSNMTAPPLATILSIPHEDVVESLATLRNLPSLFAASRVHDSYGVAHPTLPHTLALLLVLRERTTAALEAAPQNDGPLSWLPRLPAALRPPVPTAGLAAVADSATVCIYRLTDMFREQSIRFVEGREVSWDSAASPSLAAFLSYSA